jgi:hypothetical protein
LGGYQLSGIPDIMIKGLEDNDEEEKEEGNHHTTDVTLYSKRD